MSAPRERRRGLAGTVAVAALMGLALLAPGAGAGPAAARPTDPAARVAPAGGFEQTKTIERTFVDAQGAVESVTSSAFTVRADHTTDLRGRERVDISWSGAPPSGGRASNPYGENGLSQEYPVVVMQCRGRDDASLPAAQQLSPETCWTSSFFQRSQVARSPYEALWTVDQYAGDADKAPLSGVDALPDDKCKTAKVDGTLTHLTPFVAASGTRYLACDSDTMPPEAAVGSAFPASEVAAFTDGDGNGQVGFEVRSKTENESLGCSNTVACSIVVVPITGLSCAPPSDDAKRLGEECRQYGEFASGSSNFAGLGIDQAVGPALWWSASNWRNRVSIPITFGLPPDACDVLDSRPPVSFSGSELMAQAGLQWAPAYCLNKKRFKFQLNQMPDQAGWNLMQSGDSPAAFVSAPHEATGEDPVGYAPTAVTGFGIGYVIDRPDNAGEYGELRLNARLIAKLLTQSYPGSALGKGHPGLETNPLSIQADPEFVALNPGLSQRTTEAGATLLSLSNSSDIVAQLTEYIAADKDAMSFIKGKPDPWGMKVNPAYRKFEVPAAEWPLLDIYTPTTQDPCRQANPSVYLSQVAAPVTTLRKIADALIDSWPNVQTRCDADLNAVGQAWKIGRIDRQPYGARFLLGIVSLGDAERYGLRTAALRTRGSAYVAPSSASLGKAIEVAKQKKGDRLGPFVLGQDDLLAARSAYPGTQIVYTAARTHGLKQKEAATVASFIRIATTEGQRAGRANGELPEGYLPLRRSGVTAKLWRTAQATAKAVEAQHAPPAEGGAAAGGTVTQTPAAPAVEAPPAGAPEAAVPAAPAEPAPTVTARTEAASSGTALSMLPALLVIGTLAAAASLVTRLMSLRRRWVR
ncbi:hypothetical protein [Nocardioides nitrophenolicus]|uniref:hypothetical protein n=1 Tax=Nocardioides nitrophenolicus TaxID=60489 RepID=UPI00195E2A31|nr:hypothetical protein [Nocardioides nitrophenolicus]MBM7516067.1 hypothetical protein [Nocardioides nitrophenolicus]